MKHLFIINPAAGSRDRSGEFSEAIRSACTNRGLDFEIAVSGQPGDITRIARRAAETGDEVRIYACGGDGTLNEAVNGAAGFDNAAVTVFCGGSGNDFVRIFSEPEAFRSLERLLDEPEERAFDLIRCNGNLCLNICSVGLDARVAADVVRYKRLPLLGGFRAYAASVVVNLFKHIAEHYKVQVLGNDLDGEYTMVFAGSGRYYGGGFCPVPEADPCDGLLEVLLVKKVNVLQAAGVIGKYKSGRYKELPSLVTHYQTDHLHVCCDHDTAVTLDGEIHMLHDVDISVASEKLRFFYPRGLTF